MLLSAYDFSSIYNQFPQDSPRPVSFFVDLIFLT